MEIVALVLSASGVGIGALAYYNRAKPDWQRSMTLIMSIAIAQVALGFVAFLLAH